jgi:hypothetical protein
LNQSSRALRISIDHFPVPDIFTRTLPLLALLSIVKKSLIEPAAGGEKDAVTLHCLFGGSEEGQLVRSNENPLAVGMLIPRIVMLSFEPGIGLLVNLNFSVSVSPTFPVPKLSGAG